MVRRGTVLLGALLWSYGVLLVVLKSPTMTGQPVVNPVPTPDRITLAIAILQAAPSLSSAAVGLAGITPTEALAWRTLLQDPEAGKRFKDLLASASPAGRLYALMGLQLTDREYYGQARKRLVLQGGTVRTFRGCIVSTERVADVVQEIDTGRWTSELLAGRVFP
jgi:hypothetical protein